MCRRVVYVNQDRGTHSHKKKGASVHVASMVTALRKGGADVHLLEKQSNTAMGEALCALHQEARIDFLYERYSLGGTAGSDFAVREGVAHILEVNSPLAEEAQAHRGRTAQPEDFEIDRRILGRASRVLAVSQQVAAYCVSRGAREENLFVRPNGVDVDRFQVRRDDELRETLAPTDSFVLGFHGRLRPWHGFKRLVQATAALHEAGHDIFIYAVGEGDFECELAQHLPKTAYSISDWLPHEEVGHHVACFDALPLTYEIDSPCYFSPLKLAEAMACGVVPIVPRLGDLESVVADGKSGIVYEAGDLAGLTRAIEGLVLDRDRRERLALGAVREAQTRTWEAIATEILNWAAKEGCA